MILPRLPKGVFFSAGAAMNQIGIAVGDISGKGISAALLMATIHSAVRAYQLGRMPAAEEFLRAVPSSRNAMMKSTRLTP